MTVFSIQECIISGVYVQAAIRLYRPISGQSKLARPMIELICVNVIIILMDISLLSVEYAGLYTIEATMKSLVYAIKLKIEFAVLNELKGYTAAVQRQAHAANHFCSSCGSRSHFHCGNDDKDMETDGPRTVRQFSALRRPSNASDIPLQRVRSATQSNNTIEKTVRMDVESVPADEEYRQSVMLPDTPNKRPHVSFSPKPTLGRRHSTNQPASAVAPWVYADSMPSEPEPGASTWPKRESRI